MSQSMKTWDGLRVHPDFWYPRNPQDFLRAIPDQMAVYDGRSRPVDNTMVPDYGVGPFTLQSLNGTIFVVSVADGGALTVLTGPYQPYVNPVYIGSYEIVVSNVGVLSTASSIVDGPPTWILVSPDATEYGITTPGGVITVVPL